MRDAIGRGRETLATLGCQVEEAETRSSRCRRSPSKCGALGIWSLCSAILSRNSPSSSRRRSTGKLKKGAKLTGPQISRAEKKRTALYHRFRSFLERYDYLVGPVSQVPPFSVDEPYVTEIDGVAMETYIDWMKSCYFISITGLPAISVPCGFTPDGLPVGLQIIGRHRDDFGVLQLAYAFEQATGTYKKRPAIASA